MSFWKGRDGYRREVGDEISHHIELRVQELMDGGMDREAALRAALEAFGDPGRIEAAVLSERDRQRRRSSLSSLVSGFAQDARYGARFLARNRLFSAVAIGTLALGIGATTAIFSLLDATLFRAPDVRDPETLVAVYTTDRSGDEPRSSSSYRDYVDFRDRTSGLADLAATTTAEARLGRDESRGASLVRMEMVTGNYFSLLGVTAAVGRTLLPADDRPDEGASVVLLSYGLWRDRFGGDPAIVGRTVELNGRTLEVVGVASDGYEGLSLIRVPDLWVPIRTGGALIGYPPQAWESRGFRLLLRLVGRLAPDAGVGQARAELLAVSGALREEDPAAWGERSVTVDPVGRYLLPAGAEEDLPRFMWLLAGVVGATLLLGCANLANLMLARASARRGEIGVRMAIGAGRRRLVRQLLTESLMLSAVGGMAGLFVAVALLRLLSGYELPGELAIGALGGGLDRRMLFATGVLTGFTTILCGLAPAITGIRPDAVRGLRRGGSADTRRGAGRLRRGLVAVQVALCFVLLAGSGLFLRTLERALDEDLGFAERNVAITNLSLAGIGYEAAESRVFIEALRSRLEADPRVVSMGVANAVPFAGGSFLGTFLAGVEGYVATEDEEMRIDMMFATPGYFESLGIPVLEGRRFNDSDVEGAERVALVNRSMADRYWPAGGAVGGVVTPLMPPPGEAGPIRVVGVVPDVAWESVGEAATNFVYFPRAQYRDVVEGTISRVVVAVRTRGDPNSFLPVLRQEIQSLEPDLPIPVLSTMREAIGGRLMPQRVGAVLLTAFGTLALILATVGIVGVVSYAVREQRRAIGVQIALGAQRGRVIRRIASDMATPIGLGLGVGLGAAVLLDDTIARFLYGVSAGDPLTYGSIAAGLAVVALAATLVPARAASCVDPLQVLRSE